MSATTVRAEPVEALAAKHPLLELLARYCTVLKAAWSARQDLAGPTRLADETAFLPAALSLQATPAHPAPRRAAIAICALFVIALVWAMLGQIDIVAVAPGRIVVSERTKTIQPLERSVVKRVLVRDGDAVKAGQVLVELDATNASADSASVQEQLNAAISEERRTATLLRAINAPTRALPPLPLGEGWGEGQRATATSQLQAEWSDITAKFAKLDAEHSHRQAEITTVQELIRKLESTLPIARQREADFKRLTDQGFVSSHAGQDRMRERIEMESDLATQQARLSEAQAALAESTHAKAAYLAETRRMLNERHAQASSKREQLTQERAKTEQRSRLTQLTAPVDGTVQQLAVHRPGAIVTEAQPLMVVVPDDAPMTAEVTRGSRSTHCSAIWASFWPRLWAISLSRRTCASTLSARCS